MKVGKLNKILDDTVSLNSSVTSENGFPETNIIDNNTLKLWKVTEGDVDFVLEFTTGFTAEIIGLFNVKLETDVTITTYSAYPATPIENKTITASELMGFDFNNALFELTDTSTTIVAIKLAFTGPTASFSTWAGYIWAGDLIDFGCSEQVQPGDESGDQVTITRSNRSDSNEEFNFQTYDITLPKDVDFEILREKIRFIFRQGFAIARPVLIEDSIFASPELLFGAFDAPRAAYDLFNDGAVGKTAQTTIGIREVT